MSRTSQTQALIDEVAKMGCEGSDVLEYTRDCAGDVYFEMIRGERKGDPKAFAAAAWEEWGTDVTLRDA